MENRVILSLGGNVGDVEASFKSAIELLSDQIGPVKEISSIYITQAWGNELQTDFLNQVVCLSSTKAALAVLKTCLSIEKQLGRKRHEDQKWQERNIDIDVLFYNDLITQSDELTLPHPYLHVRNFVLFPAAEILPDFIHPLLNKTISELKKECKDKLLVTKSIR